MNTRKIFIHLALFVLLILPVFSYAQQFTGGSNGLNVTIGNPYIDKSNGNLLQLITTILSNIVMPLAAVAAVGYIILAGFKYVQAQGKPAAIQEANRNLLWALIGVGVLLGASAISAVLQNTVNQFIK